MTGGRVVPKSKEKRRKKNLLKILFEVILTLLEKGVERESECSECHYDAQNLFARTPSIHSGFFACLCVCVCVCVCVREREERERDFVCVYCFGHGK